MVTAPQQLDRVAVPHADTIAIDDVLAYGRHFRIKRWHERTEDQQQRISCALTAFRTWRLRQGESFGEADPWEMDPPNEHTLNVYLAMLSVSSVPWQDNSLAALRLYFLHQELPFLFRMVELKQVRAILITR